MVGGRRKGAVVIKARRTSKGCGVGTRQRPPVSRRKHTSVVLSVMTRGVPKKREGPHPHPRRAGAVPPAAAVVRDDDLAVDLLKPLVT